MPKEWGRQDALKLVIKKFDTVIPYLEELEKKLKPKFEQRGFDVFDVAVNLVDTAIHKKVIYSVNVYGKATSAFGVQEVVLDTDTNYKGSAGVLTGPIPYPMNPDINLQFLKDLRSSLKNSRKSF